MVYRNGGVASFIEVGRVLRVVVGSAWANWWIIGYDGEALMSDDVFAQG